MQALTGHHPKWQSAQSDNKHIDGYDVSNEQDPQQPGTDQAVGVQEGQLSEQDFLFHAGLRCGWAKGVRQL